VQRSGVRATHPNVKATLMLADYARVSEGKLDVLGGGWSLINAVGPFGFVLAGIVQCPWDQTNVQHTFRLDLLDADGRGIPAADGDAVHVEGAFEAGRPAGLKPGTPLDIPFVVPFGPLELQPGRYEVRLSIDADSRADWSAAFTVVTAPPA
jgi:hypothetical protein